MIWILFAFFAAIGTSIRDVLSKKSMKNADEYLIAWSYRFFSLPFLIPVLIVMKTPILGDAFMLAFISMIIISVVSGILYMKAIKQSDLSVTVPMLAFTPIFLLITSPILIGEFPGVFGIIGVVLIFIGSYMLNIKKRKGLLDPFRALLKDNGPRAMLLVAFIYSIGSNLDKIGLVNSSPVFWLTSTTITVSIALFPVVILKSRRKTEGILKNWKILLLIGFFSAFAPLSQLFAIDLSYVAYVISIKRTSLIFSVIFGYYIFREKGIRERLTGTIIMILGVLFITLF
jgi:drug/metabolite transporter (DMT)-like permease